MSLRDRRRNERLSASLAVTLHIGGGGRVLRGVSQDVSQNGIFVQLAASVPAGSRVELVIEHGERSIAVSGTVVHVLRNFGVGVQFNHSSPAARERLAETLRRLRRPARTAG